MVGRYQKQNYNSNNNQSNLSANLANSLNIQGGMPESGNPNIKRINNIQLPGLNHSGSTERINYSNRPAQKYQSNNQQPQYEPTVPKKSKLANSKIITQAPKKSGTLNQVGLS